MHASSCLPPSLVWRALIGDDGALTATLPHPAVADSYLTDALSAVTCSLGPRPVPGLPATPSTLVLHPQGLHLHREAGLVPSHTDLAHSLAHRAPVRTPFCGRMDGFGRTSERLKRQERTDEQQDGDSSRNPARHRVLIAACG